MAQCKDCGGSGKYTGFTAIEDCRTCGGSGSVGGADPHCDGIYPLRPEDFGDLDVMELVGSGCGRLEQIHRPARTKYALHWRCVATNTVYTRFIGTGDMVQLDFNQPTEMSVQDADGPVLMTFLDAAGQVTQRAWVSQV